VQEEPRGVLKYASAASSGAPMWITDAATSPRQQSGSVPAERPGRRWCLWPERDRVAGRSLDHGGEWPTGRSPSQATAVVSRSTSCIARSTPHTLAS